MVTIILLFHYKYHYNSNIIDLIIMLSKHCKCFAKVFSLCSMNRELVLIHLNKEDIDKLNMPPIGVNLEIFFGRTLYSQKEGLGYQNKDISFKSFK